MFTLHSTLAKDSVLIKRLDLCQVRLIRDQTYPWLILVPEREGMRDLDDLSPADQTQASVEIDRASKALKQIYLPHKINVAALGNVVEQLHIHIIARFQDDPAWPAPIWGHGPVVDYNDQDRQNTLEQIQDALK